MKRSLHFIGASVGLRLRLWTALSFVVLTACCFGQAPSGPSQPYRYTVVYSNGTWQSTGPTRTSSGSFGGTSWGFSAVTGGMGDAGGFGGVSSAAAGPGTCYAKGPVTATFTWTGPAGTEPPAAIVEQTASASWSGTSGSCSDGLGGTPVPNEEGYGASSTKTVPLVKVNPGHTFSIPAVNPSANASFTSGTPPDLVAGSASVSYSAEAYPVTVVVEGTVVDSGTTYGEVSRQHSAYLSTDAPGVAFDRENWTVSGGAFKTYIHDDGRTGGPKQGYVVDLASDDLDNSSVVFHWKKEGEETVACTARVSYNWQPFGTVSAAKNVSVEKPTSFLDGTCSGVSTIVSFGLESWGNPNVTATDGSEAGIAYTFWVRPCAHFPGGSAYNAQLINASWTAWPNPVWVTTNGEYYLDTSYPYEEVATASSGAIPATAYDSDAPAYVSRIPVTWSITTAFEIHMMYASADFAEADTPLRILYWDWNGEAGNSANGSTIPGTPSKGASGVTTIHPVWNDVLSIR